MSQVNHEMVTSTKKIEFTNYQRIRSLENKYGESFYILDVNKVRDNFRRINHAFKSRYPNFIIGYSYKTNYLPYLCKELSNLGAYAEVVSRLEYDLAIKLEEDPRKIIFNGPLKSKKDIQYALENESIINIDSLYEVEYLKEFALSHKDKIIKIGIRLNFDNIENGVSSLQDGLVHSRFGICTKNGDLQSAIKEMKKVANIKIVGVHGHFSTSTRSIQSYVFKTKKLCEIAKEHIGNSIEFIDIGGGFYGELPESFGIQAPSFDEYAEAICDVISREYNIENGPTLIIEPGVSMVANTMSFITKVIDVKKVTEISFVLVDGSVHNVKPTMHKNNIPYSIVSQNDSNFEKGSYHIVGYTCMEKDYLAQNVLGYVPKKNDYIFFENVGAYTIVFNPPFIKERPAIFAKDGEDVFVVRNKETFKQFFNEELYYF